MTRFRTLIVILLLTTFFLNPAAHADEKDAKKANGGAAFDERDLDTYQSEMRALIERYVDDRGSLLRFYTAPNSQARVAQLRKFYQDWLNAMARLPFDSFGREGQVDYILLKNHLERELRQLELREKQDLETKTLLPFLHTITALEDARRRLEKINPQATAMLLNQLNKDVLTARRALESSLRAAEAPRIKKTVANRAAATLASLRGTLRAWYTFYNGYDPMFTWWNEEPYKTLDQTLGSYAAFISERIVGISTGGGETAGGGRPNSASGGGRQGGPAGGQPPSQQGGGNRVPAGARPGDASDIIGDPIGREALISELQFEMIPYTPEELIAIANKELDWCESEMKKAARELGFGDDWQKALEHVKNLYVEPGKQTELIKELAFEAIDYLEKNDLVTVPPLAKESWRMEMMTPERQLVAPFFLGGETILVSYPTNTMSHEAKMMSMRGNNPHFSRATVHHELIPGHHLQGFMTQRYRTHRSLFGTPFWGEGWALYWELLLWDMGFAKTPENKIGMLFWRMHRCARIIFSLSFHLEKMTPQECIDLLVKRVGHEADNAAAEVRRSFGGDYGPLYQVAYLLGGMQIYSLHKELVKSGRMTNRQFHDAILRNNSMPIEMVRASLVANQKLTRDFKTNWKFYGDNPSAR